MATRETLYMNLPGDADNTYYFPGERVTSVANHYTPIKSKFISGVSTTPATWDSTNIVTGIEMDDAGHTTGVITVKMPSAPTIPTALKNPAPLKIGEITYYGDVEKTVTAKDLGLTGAMVYKGTSTTAITDGGTQAPTIGGSVIAIANLQAGNVVLYSNKEFVWDGSKWELLGDEGSYKVKQTAVADPTASGTSKTFIATISQDANGKITATKKTVSTMAGASSSAAGSTGLVPAPAAGKQASFLRGDGTWAVPTDTNTTYSAGTGLSLSGTTFNHSNSITAGSVGTAQSPSHGGTFAIPKITYDAQGHITGASTVNITLPTLPSASTSQKGIVQLSSSLTSTSEITAATSKAAKALKDSLDSGLNTKVAKAGDTMTGKLAFNMSNPHIEMKDTGYDTSWYFQAYQDQLAFGPTFASAVKTDKNGNMTVPGTVTVGNKVTMQYNSTTESLDFTFA